MNNKDKQVKNDKKLILDSKESSNLQIEMNTTTTTKSNKSNKSNNSKPILVIEDDEKIQNEVIIAPQLEINKIHNEDCITGMKKIVSESVDIVICDPPYNIGKDFGNNSDKQKMDEYLLWCDEWITECLRILKPNGTMYIYGFSEILAFIRTRIYCNVRWLIWHYTNKVTPSLNFWQRTHESILCCYKNKPIFNRDDVREPYTETFLKNAAGKVRKATKGRFSNGEKETTYTAHEGGALPRDVIKVPALAGGAGKKERVDHPTQKPLSLCETLLKAAKNKEGETLVVVPFAGSGSECVAAKKELIKFIGFEINAQYIDICNIRLSNTSDNDEVEVDSEDV
jgi:site-specific DNA-methyltransferase (adenine-specific)